MELATKILRFWPRPDNLNWMQVQWIFYPQAHFVISVSLIKYAENGSQMLFFHSRRWQLLCAEDKWVLKKMTRRQWHLMLSALTHTHTHTLYMVHSATLSVSVVAVTWCDGMCDEKWADFPAFPPESFFLPGHVSVPFPWQRSNEMSWDEMALFFMPICWQPRN